LGAESAIDVTDVRVKVQDMAVAQLVGALRSVSMRAGIATVKTAWRSSSWAK
jgi:hypothetical protein